MLPKKEISAYVFQNEVIFNLKKCGNSPNCEKYYKIGYVSNSLPPKIHESTASLILMHVHFPLMRFYARYIKVCKNQAQTQKKTKFLRSSTTTPYAQLFLVAKQLYKQLYIFCITITKKIFLI